MSTKFNVVIAVYDDHDKVKGYVHCTPIGRETFETNCLLMSSTYGAMMSDGYGHVTGPRTAATILKAAGAKQRNHESADAVLTEVRRLSNYLVRDKAGRWESLMLGDAIGMGLVDEDDASEIANATVFFNVAYYLLPKRVARGVLTAGVKVWSGEITETSPSEWIDHLYKQEREAARKVAEAGTPVSGEVHPHHDAATVTTKDGRTSTLQIPG